jgi:putative membrane protein
MDEQQESVDARFLLANERTFLAWIRTALSLQVAGLGVLQFLTHAETSVRYLLGVGLVAVGSFVGATGYRRYYRNDRDIRGGRDLSTVGSSPVVAGAVIVLPLLAALVLLIAALH